MASVPGGKTGAVQPRTSPPDSGLACAAAAPQAEQPGIATGKAAAALRAQGRRRSRLGHSEPPELSAQLRLHLLHRRSELNCACQRNSPAAGHVRWGAAQLNSGPHTAEDGLSRPRTDFAPYPAPPSPSALTIISPHKRTNKAMPTETLPFYQLCSIHKGKTPKTHVSRAPDPRLFTSTTKTKTKIVAHARSLQQNSHRIST